MGLPAWLLVFQLLRHRRDDAFGEIIARAGFGNICHGN
jgi:hypothetical protein